MMGAGNHIDPYWNLYRQHTNNKYVIDDILNKMYIGELRKKDHKTRMTKNNDDDNNNNIIHDDDDDELVGINRMIVPFIACGDLNGFDSDQSYPLNITNDNDGKQKVSYHEAVQQPINPPYQEYLNLKAGKASLEVTLRSSVVDDDCNTVSIKKKKRKK